MSGGILIVDVNNYDSPGSSQSSESAGEG